MTIQADDLLEKRLSKLSDDDLMDFIRETRRSRNTLKPGSKKAKKETKTKRRKVDAVRKLVDKLSDEDMKRLLEELEG